MAKGSKDKYTDKQKRQAKKIEQGYEKKGSSEKTNSASTKAKTATHNTKKSSPQKTIKKTGPGRPKKNKKQTECI